MKRDTIRKHSLLPFTKDELENITFGKLEGEKDNMLANSFFPTKSVLSLFKDRYNYVLSPKGGGKSAIFKAFKDRLIHLPLNIFDYRNYSIININEAYGFDNNYLDTEKFKEDSNRKNYTISWALYLLVELVRDIQENHTDKNGYPELLSKIENIDIFKERFKLYNIADFISDLSLGLSFSANGQQFNISPKFNLDRKEEKLILNNLFQAINNFYKGNGLISLILIDRLDSFVRREKVLVQKNYLQGLIDCIEELSNFENFHIMLFLRTDLFYSFNIDYEYDKIRERIIKLNWAREEISNFITYRLLANNYIRENFYYYLKQNIGDVIELLKNKKRKWWQREYLLLSSIKGFFIDWYGAVNTKFYKKHINKELLEIRWESYNYSVSNDFNYLFLPSEINVEGSNLGKIDFLSWISIYFQDANSFVNPRTIIYFFNELIKEQVKYNKKNPSLTGPELIAYRYSSRYSFELFSENIIKMVYKQIQSSEVLNIFTQLKDKKFQEKFKDINRKTSEHGRFSYNEFSSGSTMSLEDSDELLKQLCLLGFCKEREQRQGSLSSRIYEVPHIYKGDLEKQHLS